MKNNWKKGFFVLLGVNLLIALIVLMLIMVPTTQKLTPNKNIPIGEHVSFLVKSNKEDLNKLINHYLKKEAKGSTIDYQVRLGNEVELYGTIPFFSEKLNMKLTFEPEALNNGDLILRQKSISIGSLHLPVAYVLKFISENYNLPKGVNIKPNEKLVYIDMQQLRLKSDTKIKVNKFNLKNDDIAFTLLVPVK